MTEGSNFFEHLESLVGNRTLWELGDQIPHPPAERGGRPRIHSGFMIMLYVGLISVARSTRRVERELRHPEVWRYLSQLVRLQFPSNPERWLGENPIRRHHYLYIRNRYLTDPQVWVILHAMFGTTACRQAVEDMGLCDPNGHGSVTNPDLSRMLYADGKVVTPVFKAKPGTMTVDRDTGEVRQARSDPDGGLHITGSGEAEWGVKFVLAACRSKAVHGRMILGFDWVPKPGGEAAVAVSCLTRLARQLPGQIGVLYDGAFRGVHLQTIMRDLGKLPVVPVTAASGGRRSGKPRTERTVFVERGTITRPDGRKEACQLYAQAGALEIMELDEAGDGVFVELKPAKLYKRRNADGRWRWYGDYRVDRASGGGTVTTRFDTTGEDRLRGFNRTEHLRPVPPSDPRYAALYPRRSDAESINRALDDSMWLGRAHSVGHARQLVDMLGYGLMINSLALHRRRQALAVPAAA